MKTEQPHTNEEHMTASDMVSSTLEMLIISRTNRPKSVCLAQMGITIIGTSLFLQLLTLQDFTKLAAHHNLKQKNNFTSFTKLPNSLDSQGHPKTQWLQAP